MTKATKKQIDFIKDIREVVSGHYPTDEELENWTIKQASNYIDKNIYEFNLMREMDFVAANPNFASKYM